MTTIPAPGADLATDERDRKVLQFALARFMAQAYSNASEAAQDKEERHHKKGAFEAFMRDAKDAERLLANLTSPAATPVPASLMPALSSLIEYERNARGSDGEPPYPVETFYLAADVQSLLTLPVAPAPTEQAGELPPYVYGRECGPNEKVWTEDAVRKLIVARQAPARNKEDK